MSDLYDKIKGDQGFLEKIIGKIPGFGGYLEKETRRDADRLLRKTIAQRYGEQLSRLAAIQTDLISSGGIEFVDDVQGAATRLRRFIDMVDSAASGYAGLFDAIKVKEDDLAKLYAFDVVLLENADRVKAAVDEVHNAVGSDGLAPAIRRLTALITECNDAFERRKEVLTSN